MRPDRYEAELASSLNNLGNHLSALGRFEEALERARETHAIYARLAATRPGRYQAELAGSLDNLGNRLSDLGRFEEALERAQEAHAIHARLAATRPARYEGDLASSLNNLGIRLSDLGRFEEALRLARDAHTLYGRLAQIHPRRHGPDLLRSRLWLAFVVWHVGQGGSEIVASWPEEMQRFQIPVHQRDRLVAWHAVIQACYADRELGGSGLRSMEQFMASFETMATHQRRPLEPYHLIAMSYLARYAPNEEPTTAYALAWRTFLGAHGGRMPARVTETIAKLGCRPPEGG